MSVMSDTLAVDLPVRRLAKRSLAAPQKFWRYLVVIGPFAAALAALKVIGSAGLISSVVPWLHPGTITNVVLTTNAHVLADARGLPLWLFLLVGTTRGCLGDPLNYYFAQRSASFVEREAKSRVGRWLAQRAKRAEGWHPNVILGIVFVTISTGYLLGGVPIPLNSCWIAGAARVPLRRVMVVDLAARTAGLLFLYHYGSPLDAALKAAS